MFDGVIIAPCQRLGSSGSRNKNPINESPTLPLTDVVSISKKKFPDLVGKKSNVGTKDTADLNTITQWNKMNMDRNTLKQLLDQKMARYNGVGDPFTQPIPLFDDGPIIP